MNDELRKIWFSAGRINGHDESARFAFAALVIVIIAFTIIRVLFH